MGYHKPALLHESIDGLYIKPKGTYVDLTFGGGGHSLEVLKKLGKNGKLVVFDQDQDALANVPDDKRLIFVGANFRYLKHFLRYHAIEKVDGILADLGISSFQIDQPGRGFSFKSDTALDMRMDVRNRRTASQLLNEAPREELVRIFKSFGELGNASAISGAIEESRMQGAIETTVDLEEVLRRFIPRQHPSKFLARVYQALRIEVNREMEALREMLIQTAACMNTGGRLVVITYHSIEDRVVKNYMRSGNLEGEIEKDFYGNIQSPWKLVNRSVITPSEEEIKENNRARSAKLRIAERTGL
ncbi:MAG: 16S rRNA (cytosine(1402)-N(4))-methyltransferase RsmH [Bacteroidales bacterium]|nr:16S rRNA (cytosine(1402)-N(4))-methyltransferase RsmH [Bacteroidales bacterium]